MSAAGWITMLAAIGGASALFAWCLWRVLRTPGATEHIHAQTDIEPSDQHRP